MVRSVDSGASWAPQSSGTVNALRDVSAASGTEVWASGAAGAFQTFDGGLTWNVIAAGGSGSNTGVVSDKSGRATYINSIAGITQVQPTIGVPDHAPGAGAGWTSNVTSFGVCLESVAAGAVTDGATWTPNPGCAPVDGAGWRAVPVSTTLPGAQVARAPSGAIAARADLRFGLRVSSNQRAGNYVAPIRFEVLAPG